MRAGGFPLGNGGGFGGSGGGFGIVATVGLRGASISFANVGRGGVLGFLRDRAAVHSPPESEFAASSSVGSGVFDRGVVGASGSSSASSATVISSRSTSRATFVSARFALDDEDFRFFFEDAPPADLLELASPPRRTSSSSSNALSAASKRASSSALTCSLTAPLTTFTNVAHFASSMPYAKCAPSRLSARTTRSTTPSRAVDLYLSITGWILRCKPSTS